ncbi:MAG TPA: sterol desaturase family protein [Bacteroidales bacterium]|nr:sterol desaturase family protein [Bacteroidales bacterium]
MPDILLIAVTLFISFWFMEFVAWSNHKYLMHGPLWFLHRDHHENVTKGIKAKFEKNDVFFLVYAIPAATLIITGFASGSPLLASTGFGFTLYGAANFWVHDILYHRRFNLFNGELKNSYLRAAVKAHDAHHKPKIKADFNVYGLLVFPHRFFREVR